MAAKRKKRSLGKRLDKILFGIPEDRRPLGFRNPAQGAKRRKLYQAGYIAGRKNPGDPAGSLVAVQRTALFKEAAVGDANAAKEFFLAGYSDGMERGNPGEFAKCMASKPNAPKPGTPGPWHELPASVAKGGNRQYQAIEYIRKRLKPGVRWTNEYNDGPNVVLVYFDPEGREVRVTVTPAGRYRAQWHAVPNPSRRKSKTCLAAKPKRHTVHIGEKVSKRNPSSVSVDGRVVFTGNIQEVTALAARLKSEGLKVTSAPAAKGSKMGWRKNPATNPATKTLQEAYAGFHGEPSEETLRFQERYHYHKHTWTLGPLVYLKVWLPSDRRQPGLRNFAEIKFDYEAKIPVLVTANEKRNQMFFERGDQSVDLKVFDVPPEPHETVVLGEVSDAYYFTTKKHLGNQGGTAIYKHKLGEEGGELPMLLYHPLEKRLSLAGGSYTIPDEGVRN